MINNNGIETFSKMQFSLKLNPILITLILSLPTSVIAGERLENLSNNLLGGYVASPDAQKVDQQRSLGSGSRSNCSSANTLAENSLRLLVPEDEVVHLTTSKNPTFYFYSETASNIPLKFTLVIPDPSVPEPLVEKQLAVKTPGIQQITLPKSLELKSGEVYLWYVGVPCNNNVEEIERVLQAGVMRIPLSSALNRQLDNTTTTSEKADIYLQQGIWYDAVELLVGLH